jgi:hypothetical protein
MHQGICLDIDNRIIVCRAHLFGQGAIPIELSEQNSYPHHRLMPIKSSDSRLTSYSLILIDAQ